MYCDNNGQLASACRNVHFLLHVAVVQRSAERFDLMCEICILCQANSVIKDRIAPRSFKNFSSGQNPVYHRNRLWIL